ncbi:ABC transporter substrate-binding protein [Frigidibacter sp. SD6-1]|uniref:ABC transporter substrate-binding protein n=1 Tax=Frigidibacter sp. SD6-1 TaxID=3032581 RepID=UPI0024DF76C9|nr:ABC transporter substrate-binding protein [Frigidibacter sp. SD6-1]
MKDDLAKLLDFIDSAGLSRRSFLTRSAAFGATAVVGTALATGRASAQEPKKGGILKMGLGGGEATDTLDPGLADSQVPFALNRNWGDTIVRVTPDGQIEPRLAEAFSSNPEGTEWTFTIRQGVKFHDGSDMTVDDVVATFKRHSDENAKSGALGIMKGISDISADGQNVVMKMETGNADLPYLLSDYHLVIQPKGGVDNPAAGIGTGAYKVVSAEAGVRYVLEKNADDWDTSRGHYDGVEILVINDSTARNSALQAGQVHMINRVDPKVAQLLSKTPGVVVTNISGPGHYVFIMHCDTAPFDNNDLRLALKYSINRQEMVDKILNGYGGVGNDIPINGSYPLFDETMEQRPFDLAKAAEHYKASGHDGSPIELLVADGAFPGAVDAATLWQASCEQAGIPLVVKKVPDDGYWSDVWNVKPFCASYWGGRPVQDQMYSTAYLSTAEWNDTRFKDPEFDALILQARAETDTAKRQELYSKIGHILHDNGGVIVPMFNDYIDGHSDTVAGWLEDPTTEMMGGWAAQKTWFA